MTLREIFTYIENCASQVPGIRTFVENDVLKLNEMREAKYGVFAITQNSHSTDLTHVRFSLNLFYIDRLVNSQDNEVQIQSHAIEVLRQVLNLIGEEVIEVSDAQFNVFTDRFQDLCAGAWVTATFTTAVGDCYEI